MNGLPTPPPEVQVDYWLAKIHGGYEIYECPVSFDTNNYMTMFCLATRNIHTFVIAHQAVLITCNNSLLARTFLTAKHYCACNNLIALKDLCYCLHYLHFNLFNGVFHIRPSLNIHIFMRALFL